MSIFESIGPLTIVCVSIGISNLTLSCGHPTSINISIELLHNWGVAQRCYFWECWLILMEFGIYFQSSACWEVIYLLLACILSLTFDSVAVDLTFIYLAILIVDCNMTWNHISIGNDSLVREPLITTWWWYWRSVCFYGDLTIDLIFFPHALYGKVWVDISAPTMFHIFIPLSIILISLTVLILRLLEFSISPFAPLFKVTLILGPGAECE